MSRVFVKCVQLGRETKKYHFNLKKVSPIRFTMFASFYYKDLRFEEWPTSDLLEFEDTVIKQIYPTFKDSQSVQIVLNYYAELERRQVHYFSAKSDDYHLMYEVK